MKCDSGDWLYHCSIYCSSIFTQKFTLPKSRNMGLNVMYFVLSLVSEANADLQGKSQTRDAFIHSGIDTV